MVELYNVSNTIDKEINNFELRLKTLVEEYSHAWTTIQRKNDILQEQKWICEKIETFTKLRDRIDRVIDRNRELLED